MCVGSKSQIAKPYILTMTSQTSSSQRIVFSLGLPLSQRHPWLPPPRLGLCPYCRSLSAHPDPRLTCLCSHQSLCLLLAHPPTTLVLNVARPSQRSDAHPQRQSHIRRQDTTLWNRKPNLGVSTLQSHGQFYVWAVALPPGHEGTFCIWTLRLPSSKDTAQAHSAPFTLSHDWLFSLACYLDYV